MINFLKETVRAIGESGHTIEDIIFIGVVNDGPSESCTWDEFLDMAYFNYDNGYGGARIRERLIIVFSDGGRMFRGEYDGSEWWEWVNPFVMPDEVVPLKRLEASYDLD